MKYNVLGFYQPRAIELGLCSDDLLVLRWFVDFAGTPKMRTMIIDNQIYYWVNYSTVLEELPILKISKQTLYKKHFTNLCNANVLIHKQVKDGGNFSYYCYGINYETLVYLQTGDTPLVKNNDLVSEFTKGSVEMYQTLVSKSTEQRLDNNKIILQDNIKEKVKKEKFVPPTLEEVKEYAKSRGREDLAIKFFEYFDTGKWIDSEGKPVKNWKQKFITWDNKNQKPQSTKKTESREYSDKQLNDLFDNVSEIQL